MLKSIQRHFTQCLTNDAPFIVTSVWILRVNALCGVDQTGLYLLKVIRFLADVLEALYTNVAAL